LVGDRICGFAERDHRPRPGSWRKFGAAGAIIGAIMVGLVDVDSVTVSLARMIPIR
jgi:hypothetical protein